MTDEDEKLRLDMAVMDARDRLLQQTSSTDPRATSHLATLLYRRFIATRNRSDLDEAIREFEKAVALSSPTDEAEHRAILATALYSRFTETRLLTDLDMAKRQAGMAAALEPDGYNRAILISNVAALMYESFQITSKTEDIESAISALDIAINSGHLDNENLCAQLSNLSVAMRASYTLTGRRSDLDGAIEAARTAVALSKKSDEEWSSRLITLGSALMEASQDVDDPELLNEAIALFQQAVSGNRQHSTRHVNHLVTLGYALSLRSRHSGDKEDLDQAVRILQLAMSATPEDDPALDEIAILLSAGLERRFAQSGTYVDLSEAIDLARRALSSGGLSRRQHRPSLTLNLGMLLAKRSESPAAHPEDASESLAAITSIVAEQSIEPAARIAAVRVAVQHATDRSSWTEAINLLRSMLDAVSNSFFVSHQTDGGALISGLAADGASCAVVADDIDGALAFFEASRSTVLTAERERRNVTRRLRRISPAIAHRLDRISISPEGVPPGWDDLVADVRGLESFEAFMRLVPPRVDMDLGASEIAVAVNVSRYGSFAFVMHAEGTHVVALPDLSIEESASFVDEYTHDVLQSHTSNRGESQLRAESTLSDTLSWLADVVVRPVAETLPWLPETEVINSSHRRIFWCLGGPISILPIHAVSIYLDIQGDSSLNLLGNSTYIPNLGFLSRSERYQESASAPDERPLVVSAGTGHGGTDLVASSMEISAIQRSFSNSDILKGSDADIGSVLRELPLHTMLHFSGHGRWDPTDSLASGLQLRDGFVNTDRLLRLDVGRTKLAVLSASCTALGSARRPGAFVHPAAALLVAGAENVVGTVLSVRDRSAGEFTAEFYEILTTTQLIDGASIAQAVNEAVRRLARKYPNTPTNWVPFVHIGR